MKAEDMDKPFAQFAEDHLKTRRKKKYKVGVDYEIKGICYFTVEADSEDDAAARAERLGEDYASQSIIDGNGRFECECCDVMESLKGKE